MSICILTTLPMHSNELASLVKSFYHGVPVKTMDIDAENLHGYLFIIKCHHEYIDDKIKIQIELYEGSKMLLVDTQTYKTNDKTLEEDKRRQIKNYMKLLLYGVLEKYTGYGLDWGTLTGIRPIKIVHSIIDKGLNDQEILVKLYEDYRISHKKARLILDISKIQEPYFKDNHYKKISIYINIPICTTKCLFCSFPSDTLENCAHLVDDYISTLIKEMKIMSRMANEKGMVVHTIYVGGGTPTSLNIHQLERILKAIERYWGKHNWKEYTMEAGRPDTIDRDKLSLLKEYGVSRISINPQTMNDETLITIGRNHTSQQIIHCFHLARDIGFDSINMDVIIGLPGEGIENVYCTMEAIKRLAPDNLTVHTLAVKRASILKDRLDDFQFVASEKAGEMMNIFHDGADNMGMRPYYLYRQKYMLGNMENIGFSLPSKESVYNMQIMENRQSIWAFGAAAITRVYHPEDRIERVPNVKNIEEYINRIDEMIDRKLKSVF